MSGTVAVILPPAGPGCEAAATLVRHLHLMPGHFRAVVFGPAGQGVLGVDHLGLLAEQHGLEPTDLAENRPVGPVQISVFPGMLVR